MQGATRVPCAFLRRCDGRADSQERGQPNDDDLEPRGRLWFRRHPSPGGSELSYYEKSLLFR